MDSVVDRARWNRARIASLRLVAALLSAAPVATGAVPAHAEIVVSPAGHYREVIGQAFSNASTENTTTPGFFDEVVSAGFGQTNVTLSAGADQSSQTPELVGPTISGRGGAAYAAGVAAPVGSLFATSDSNLRVQFTVEASEAYNLSTFVRFDGTLPAASSAAGNRAIVTLQDTFTGDLLAQMSRDSSDPGSSFASEDFLLQQGRQYLLIAQAETFVSIGSVASGSFSGDTSWSLQLTAVPEPAHARALRISTLLAALGLRARRARETRPAIPALIRGGS